MLISGLKGLRLLDRQDLCNSYCDCDLITSSLA